MNKIDVTEYLNNNELLEVYYTPYAEKLNIVDSIISETMTNKNNVNTIDTAEIQAIATTIIIQSITNIDMTFTDDNGLSGYDLLCKENKLESLINIISVEYNRFFDILEMKLADFRNNQSAGVVISKASNEILSLMGNFVELTKSIDLNKVQELVDLIPSKEDSHDE